MKSRLKAYRVKTYGKNSDKVVFLYCPFGIRRWQLRLPFLPIERLIKHGYQVVVFDFNVRRVTSSAQEVFAILDAVKADTEKRISVLKRHGVTNISVFGTSMGTQFAMYVAASLPEIRKVVLNLAYGDLYEQMLAFPEMRFLSKERIENFMKSAGSSNDLQARARQYSSVVLAPKFKGRDVLLYLAREDKVLPYSISRKFKSALEKHRAHVTYLENNADSHYRAALRNHLNSKEYLAFLDKK
jgi:pimeloyl-ACP methyl ester carboxylesterase